MWLGWEAFMLHDILWNLVIVVVVFIMYALFALAVGGFIAFGSVDRKSKIQEKRHEDDPIIKKAS